MPEAALRVVIDTSSLVSYLLTKGAIMSKVISAWRAGDFWLISSPQTLEELETVLSRAKIRARSTAPLDRFPDGLKRYSLHVPGALALDGVCSDPKDDKFVACALEGGAQYLVSSDRHLLALEQYQGVCILNPGQFLVALQLANSSSERLRELYSTETLRSVLAEICLDAETREKITTYLDSG